MTKLALRFIERAIRESDHTGHFDPSRMMRCLNLNEYQLNEVAQELVNSGDLLVSYSRDGLHRWQLLGSPRPAPQEPPPRAAEKTAPAVKPASSVKSHSKARPVPAPTKRAARKTARPKPARPAQRRVK